MFYALTLRPITLRTVLISYRYLYCIKECSNKSIGHFGVTGAKIPGFFDVGGVGWSTMVSYFLRGKFGIHAHFSLYLLKPGVFIVITSKCPIDLLLHSFIQYKYLQEIRTVLDVIGRRVRA